MAISINGTSGISGVDGSAATPALQGSDSNTGISFGTDEVNINTGGSTRATVDSSGRLLVGTTTARTNFSSSTDDPQLQIESANGFSWASIRNSNSTGGAYAYFAKSRGTGNVVLQNNDIIGGLNFEGNDGSKFVTAAQIRTDVDGTPGPNAMPGRLVFSTTPSGSATPVERMRVASNGNISINGQQTSVSYPLPGNGNLRVSSSSFGGTALTLFDAVNYTAIQFIREAGGVPNTVGSVTCTDFATAFNTSSDYRLKENVVSLTGAADRVKQLKPSQFNFIVNPSKTVDGFIAHEAQAVVPECVTGTKDEVDAEGNPVYQGIDQSKLVPLLTAALQEALTRIEQLETKVAALEGGAN